VASRCRLRSGSSREFRACRLCGESNGLLVRAEYYETDEDAKQEVAGEAELIIAKQRNGPVGDVPSFL
jgi:replicative DNA helicase